MMGEGERKMVKDDEEGENRADDGEGENRADDGEGENRADDGEGVRRGWMMGRVGGVG